MPFGTYVTAAELAQVAQNRYLDSLIEAIQTQTTIFNHFATREVIGTRYKSLAVAQLPTAGGFLNINEGFRSYTTSLTMGEFAMSRVGSAVKVAQKSAELWNHERGTTGPLSEYHGIQAHYQHIAELRNVERQIIYGTANDAKGFPGMKQLTPAALASNVLSVSGDPQADEYGRTTINAGGTTASTASSVYIVKYGPMYSSLVMGGPTGMRGFLNMSPWRQEWLEEADPADNNIVKGQYFDISIGEGFIGLSVAGSNESNRPYKQHALRRIFNLTADSGKGLTDTLLDAGVNSFPVSGGRPDVIFMSQRSGRQLRDSRPQAQIHVPGGDPVAAMAIQPLPETFRGIPIIYSDLILNTDPIEVPA